MAGRCAKITRMSVPRPGERPEPRLVQADWLSVRAHNIDGGQYLHRDDLVRWLRICVAPKDGPVRDQISAVLDAMADMIADGQYLPVSLTRALDDLIDTAIQLGRDSST